MDILLIFETFRNLTGLSRDEAVKWYSLCDAAAESISGKLRPEANCEKNRVALSTAAAAEAFMNYVPVSYTHLLRRIAFGSYADAVKLMFFDAPDEQKIEELDLFNIAEIKRPKGGGLEIKFFDRLKALEKLSQLEEGSEDASFSPFYEALKKGAEALEEG